MSAVQFDLDSTFVGEVPETPDGMSWPQVAAWHAELLDGDSMTYDALCASIPALAAIRDGLRVVTW